MYKFKKYKKKYIDLKYGGSETPEQEIKIYSFNVLNPDPLISKYTFNAIYNIFSDDQEKTNKNNLLSNIDKKRFDEHKINKIIEIINICLQNDIVIICLQEVCLELLNKLKETYINNIRYTAGDLNFRDGKCSEKNEYRVTIINDNLSFINSNEIQIVNKCSIKNGLYTLIKINDSNKHIHTFNFHFYWDSHDEDLHSNAEKINNIINKTNYPFIICGDFNKSLCDISRNFIDKIPHIIHEEYKEDTLENFTALDSRNIDKPLKTLKLYPESDTSLNEIKVAKIDHILVGHSFDNTKKIKNTEDTVILNEFSDNCDSQKYKIFYDLNRIQDEFNKFILDRTEQNIVTEFNNDWKEKHPYDDISDHKLIYKKITI